MDGSNAKWISEQFEKRELEQKQVEEQERNKPFNPESWGWQPIESGGAWIEAGKFSTRYELYGSEGHEYFPEGATRIIKACENVYTGIWPNQRDGETLMKLLGIEKQ